MFIGTAVSCCSGQCILSYWLRTEQKIQQTLREVTTSKIIVTSDGDFTKDHNKLNKSDLPSFNLDERTAEVMQTSLEKDELLTNNDATGGDVQLVSFTEDKSQDCTGYKSAPAVLDVISEESSTDVSPDQNCLPQQGNYFSRYHYETFRTTHIDFSKLGKSKKEVLPVKETKTSLKRKRFTENKLVDSLLQGHS